MRRRNFGAQQARGARRIASAVLAMTLAVAAVPSAAEAKTILVIGTHPDDETLMAAGRSRTALNAGDTIKIAIVTNGDATGVTTGLYREGLAIGSAQALGLREQDVIFLGYPDGSMRQIYDSTSGTLVFTSQAGQTATYGNRGLGLMDYHRFLTGASAPYNRNSVASDLQALLINLRPDEIYTHSTFEGHGDHQAVAFFVLEALASLRRSGSSLAIKLYQGVVWMPWRPDMPTSPWSWPQLTSSGWTPSTPFLPYSFPCSVGDCLDLTQWETTRLQRFVQPPEMQLTDITTNMKSVAIAQFGGTNPWYVSFTRRDEMYWLTDFGRNVALTAQVSASSENGAGQAATRAVDGIIAGAPNDPNNEWVTNGELGGAWLQFNWPAAVRIAQVNLYDRPDTTENILSGTLTFSDGTSLSVGALPTNGRVMPVTFAPKTVSWVRFTVNRAEGTATGLSEMQVLGVPATSTVNNPPHFILGPVPASETIPASQSTNLSVVAHDIDGDPIQYQWSTEAGFIQANGASAIFTPPSVTADTYVAITVQILDGRGGSASNSAFVRVTPAPTNSITVTPAAVFAGSSAQGSVVLATAAPAGGTAIPLSSSSPAVASVPASVTVLGGSTSATFPIATGSVSASTSVTISAAFASGTRSAPLTVSPPSVSSVTLNPTNVLGGVSSQGTVTLPLAAAGQGSLIQLSSSNPSLASVPANVTVAAGATTATFPITTTAVSSPTAVTISATYGTTASATLTVSPLAISAVLLNPSSVIGGSTSQGTAVLNGPASGSGAVVALSSANTTVAAVPATVTVPAGADRATFTISTGVVTTTRGIAISASFAGATQSATLGVTPNTGNPNLLANPEQIGTTPWEILGPIALTLNYAAAPDGTLSATRAVVTSTAGHALRQGASVTPGSTYTFSVFAKNNGGASAAYSIYDATHGANIVAPTSYFSQLNGSTYVRVGVTFTVPPGCTFVYVYPLRDSGGPVDVLLWGAKLEVGTSMTGYQFPSSDSVSVSPSTVASGGSAQGTVTLAVSAPAGGTTIALTSSSPSVASVPANVTVPAGATSATFPVTAGNVTTTTTVTISAAFASGTRTASLTVTSPPTLSSLVLNPSSVVGGSSSQGTVTLTGPASGSGAVVSLSSNNPAASVPASVTVFAGSSTATFSIATSAVQVSTSATITASYGGTTSTPTLTVLPPALSTIALNPTSVVGGNPSTGTVALSGPAPSGGVTVTLASNDTTTATVPGSVTVPAGSSSATFPVSTTAVTVTRTPVISATLGSISRSATLTVTNQATSNPNLLSSPEQIGVAPWQVLGPISLTQNFAAAPDSTIHATRAVVTSTAGHAVRQGLGVTPGQTYTFSFFARNNGGTAAAYSVYDGTHFADIVAATSYFSQLNGSTYTRVSVTFTVPPGGTTAYVYPLRDSAGPVDVLLWGAKLEVGATMSAYP